MRKMLILCQQTPRQAPLVTVNEINRSGHYKSNGQNHPPLTTD